MRLSKVVALTTVLSLWYPAAHADGLKSLADGMFSNFTTSGSINTASRGGAYLGSARIRTPVSTVQFATFDPPRVAAGCGGLDLAGGSFTFLKKDELIQFLKNTAQNATFLLFKMGIASINPMLSTLLAEAKALDQAISNMNMNSCKVAQGMATGIAEFFSSDDKMSYITDAVSKSKNAMGTLVDDFSDAWDKAIAAVQSSGGIPDNDDAIKNAPPAGIYNQTWRALVRSKAADNIAILTASGSTATLSDEEKLFAREVVMSLLGTTTMRNETPCTGSGSCGDTKTIWRAPLFSLGEFLNGPEVDSPLLVYQCVPVSGSRVDLDSETDCQKLNIRRLKITEYMGIRGKFCDLIFGNSDCQTVTTTGAIYKLIYCSDAASGTCGLTSSQKALIETAPLPIMRYIMLLQKSPGAAEAIMTMLKQPIVDAMIASTIGELQQIMATAFTDVTDIQIADEVKKRINDLYDESVQYQEKMAEAIKYFVEAETAMRILTSSQNTALNR